MALSDREMSVLAEIRDWEKRMREYEPNDIQLTYEKYLEAGFSMLPEEVQNKFFSLVDTWMFHLNAMIQGSQFQLDAKDRIMASARVFNKQIHTIEDLQKLDIDQLNYIAQQQIAKHRLYSFAQGAMAGTGGTLLLGMDIPAMAVINLRAVQLLSMTYGVEGNTPFEMMTALKVFHTATLPPRLQSESWNSLLQDLKGEEERYFYQGNDRLTDVSWLEQPIRQLLKAMVIAAFRKKLIQGLPLVSVAVGAASNYQLTRRVTDFSHNYYRLRYLMKKEDIL
ncbi:ABC transporter substrate-binding protein [Bacillus sp. FJAT-27225]|uniref:EcsC family protein n=1 Tax=Bacillus sp. FJAT-27225 TaxID=1743144 RepID=UPI00080C31B7|nr:EcsC family protein [Bacillus sp. FJAT-27225]OCA91383.1 ABC transporter substrate-binding protein [Bacillus sp. FJAT-27225]